MPDDEGSALMVLLIVVIFAQDVLAKDTVQNRTTDVHGINDLKCPANSLFDDAYNDVFPEDADEEERCVGETPDLREELQDQCQNHSAPAMKIDPVHPTCPVGEQEMFKFVFCTWNDEENWLDTGQCPVRVVIPLLCQIMGRNECFVCTGFITVGQCQGEDIHVPSTSLDIGIPAFFVIMAKGVSSCVPGPEIRNRKGFKKRMKEAICQSCVSLSLLFRTTVSILQRSLSFCQCILRSMSMDGFIKTLKFFIYQFLRLFIFVLKFLIGIYGYLFVGICKLWNGICCFASSVIKALSAIYTKVVSPGCRCMKRSVDVVDNNALSALYQEGLTQCCWQQLKRSHVETNPNASNEILCSTF